MRVLLLFIRMCNGVDDYVAGYELFLSFFTSTHGESEMRFIKELVLNFQGLLHTLNVVFRMGRHP